MSEHSAENDAQVTHAWRGVPPASVSHKGSLPTWKETAGFTSESARALLTEHYGINWTLEVQTTTVSEWCVTPPERTE